ncbi:MAG TPA: hypothetical protein VN685_07965 [Rhizomicrobium sp.]|nr:hypothetical protein [Rhizomicrobium sp.]
MFWKSVSPENSAAETRNRLESIEMPETGLFEASVTNILANGLGFRKTIESGVCALGDGRIIPMMSYALVEYLMGLDLAGFDLLELGGGHSTEFWSQRVKSVITLETDPEWARILKSHALPNVDVRATGAEQIAQDMAALGRRFDAIIVDASASRYRCAKAAVSILKDGGFILLDNADWYPNTTAMLRDADLIQVDFPDFRPLRWYRCASSLFLHPNFRARPRYERLPQPLIGGKDIAAKNDWDRIE